VLMVTREVVKGIKVCMSCRWSVNRVGQSNTPATSTEQGRTEQT